MANMAGYRSRLSRVPKERNLYFKKKKQSVQRTELNIKIIHLTVLENHFKLKSILESCPGSKSCNRITNGQKELKKNSIVHQLIDHSFDRVNKTCQNNI